MSGENPTGRFASSYEELDLAAVVREHQWDPDYASGGALYLYRVTLNQDAPAAMSKVADMPALGQALSNPKFQYFNPRGFGSYGQVTRVSLMGIKKPD